TGYILAGLLLGPSGFNLVSTATIGSRLDHFTQIALMLIAFGIGEHIELSRLRTTVKSIGLIAVLQALGAFILVTGAIFFVAEVTGFNGGSWHLNDYFALAILLGAVGVATAPAALLHVIRELRAAGPLTSTLMAVVAIDDGLCIMIFGLSLSIAANVAGAAGGSLAGAVLTGLSEISLSLLAGILTGLLLDFVLPRLKKQEEMLTAGLGLLLLCGEICRHFHLSPLLAGMAAGFIIINRDTRDVRLFRALNAFEPPIYVLFFTLAGTHLELSAVTSAGWIGLIYFLTRILGKIGGSYLGAKMSGASRQVQLYLGPALIPQAGVAIGLIFLISGDANLAVYAEIITPVVLTTVVLSELIGPLCVRYAVEKAGEVHEFRRLVPEYEGKNEKTCELWHQVSHGIRVVPWTWKKLIPPPGTEGVVAFGSSNPSTVPGLARIATLLAYHFKAVPMSVRILTPGQPDPVLSPLMDLFRPERDEVKNLGYNLETELIHYENVAEALVSAVEYNEAKAVILGFPVEGTFQGFQEILETVARHVACPVLVLRMYDSPLHTERILVSVVDSKDLQVLGPVIQALSRIGPHRLTMQYLLHAGASLDEVETKKNELVDWSNRNNIASPLSVDVVSTEARQETIVAESAKHDLVVMGASRKNVLKKLFFGSLAETVAHDCRKSLLIVYRSQQDLS
ncbi:MAG: cation:proton antiporter, partial [Thermodesulfobacteriota bacterium]|nr:cation:proton antiporter [Thermodesulfobacteriota bacterium]